MPVSSPYAEVRVPLVDPRRAHFCDVLKLAKSAGCTLRAFERYMLELELCPYEDITAEFAKYVADGAFNIVGGRIDQSYGLMERFVRNPKWSAWMRVVAWSRIKNNMPLLVELFNQVVISDTTLPHLSRYEQERLWEHVVNRDEAEALIIRGGLSIQRMVWERCKTGLFNESGNFLRSAELDLDILMDALVLCVRGRTEFKGVLMNPQLPTEYLIMPEVAAVVRHSTVALEELLSTTHDPKVINFYCQKLIQRQNGWMSVQQVRAVVYAVINNSNTPPDIFLPLYKSALGEPLNPGLFNALVAKLPSPYKYAMNISSIAKFLQEGRHQPANA